ncbi:MULTISPECIES: SapC family protein [unclassified Caulobacter]|uniref:SapC family protein n=1 Tax=unclassified Caulobacter TaxID=2648921 RepID=UPI0006F9FAD6|nr:MULTISPECIES: SapC family protein [unclassified Caulobacter]KQV58663.1 peptide ABC transporter permease [Caulobacter sp. Root342]KQV68828.1 peptide ABC transporter permease [Caulobacter sp. Root343]
MNRVLLNNVDHADLRVIAGHGAAFGDAINQVLVLPTEFEAVQREYPILIRKDASGAYQAVALLGLDRDENLFLDETGWNARYVPAVQRRGPFSIALQRDEPGGEPRPMIHVDLDHPRISRVEGEPLFLPAGGNAPYLQGVSRALGQIHDGLDVAGPMFAFFDELGLIEPIDVEIKLDDNTRYDLPDVFTLAPDRLAAVTGEPLERLHQSGLLRAAHWIISSMGNIEELIARKASRRAAQEASAA